MPLDPVLGFGLLDTITIEPFLGLSSAHVATYGPPVTYQAQVLPWTGRTIKGSDGRDITPNMRVIIEGRIAVDERSRATLPADALIVGTRTPPIRAVQPSPANDLSLDYTEILF